MAANLWASPIPTQLLSKLGSLERLNPEAVRELRAHAGEPIAVACSGGPDSVAAALIVRELHPGAMVLMHYNHHLRGEDADADEKFVQELAEGIGAAFRVGHWSPPANVTETAAREARFEFLHGWEHPAIVFGHHADDVAETFLMRLARGAGPEGVFAPHSVNRVRGHIHIRPLIELRKAEIVGALDALGLPYRIDGTNSGEDYLRNKIRNQLLPLWQSFEPSRDVVAGLLNAREGLRELFEGPQSTSKILSDGTLSAPDLHDPYRTTLVPGTILFLPNGFSISATRISAPSLDQIKRTTDPAHRVWVRDLPALIIKSWAHGERYTPMGAPGSRKVKELLSEAVISCAQPPPLRSLWPIVSSADRTPLWLPGARPTAAAAVGADDKFALELHFGPTGPSLTKDV